MADTGKYLESLYKLLGSEVQLDDTMRALSFAVRALRPPMVGALQVTCSDESEKECCDAFQRRFVQQFLPSLKFGGHFPFRTANLGGRYEWGSIRIAENHLAAQPKKNAFKVNLINVNIHDITDESEYIAALGKDEAKIKVAEQERDGDIGNATAVQGENEAGVKIAQSNADRREKEAEAERQATAAEKVTAAQALQEAYAAEEAAERERAKREEATQEANVLVAAEIEKKRIETLAEADAEKIRRLKKGEADGLLSMMGAEAEGLMAILTRKAEGFNQIVRAAANNPELASLLMVTEQLPKLVEEQVKAISNLKIDSVTVWESGGNCSGKTNTAGRNARIHLRGDPLHACVGDPIQMKCPYSGPLRNPFPIVDMDGPTSSPA